MLQALGVSYVASGLTPDATHMNNSFSYKDLRRKRRLREKNHEFTDRPVDTPISLY
jgi:hypothetical protein